MQKSMAHLGMRPQQDMCCRQQKRLLTSWFTVIAGTSNAWHPFLQAHPLSQYTANRAHTKEMTSRGSLHHVQNVHLRLTFQGKWDLDKLEDQLQQVLSEEA